MNASISMDTRKRTTPWHVTYRQLLRSVGKDASGMRLSLIGLVLAAAIQGLTLACIVPIMRSVFSPTPAASAWPWIMAMVLLGGLSIALRWRAQGFEFDGRLAEATHRLRTGLGEQLRRMPLEQLQDKRSGELNAMVLGNVDENLSYSLMIINMIAIALVTPLFSALALLFVDWRMAIALLLVFPAIIPLYRWRRPAYNRGTRVLADACEHASASVLEYTQGLPILRAACQTGEKAERLAASFAHLEAIQTLGQRKGSKPNLIITSVLELGLLLVLGMGVLFVLDGSLDVATLAALFVITVRFAEPLASFVSYTAVLEVIEAALERIETLMAVEPLPQAQPQQVPTRFDVRFENVSFKYAQGDAPALREIDAILPAQSLTALVGPSGSGKTTVTRLLMRQADPLHGRILIGGIDVRCIPRETLQTLISVVFQDVYLFDDTVLGNIRMARPDATETEVEAAARAAQCLDFIERLPQGWHTRLGDIGGRLSGGERQRISIARALLKNAPIVILDEPTAALDTESEVAVQRAIDALVRKKTVLVIAHRLSTVVGADQILVIDDGCLAENGRHADLLQNGGRYSRMWLAQQEAKQWHVSYLPT